MSNHKLNIDKSLPQIIIPKDKLQIFIDWYNDKLIAETELPEIFNEGYIKIDLSEILECKIPSIFEIKNEKEYLNYKKLSEDAKNRYTRLVVYFKLVNTKLEIILFDAFKNKIYDGGIDLYLNRLAVSVVMMGSSESTKHTDKLKIPELKIDFASMMSDVKSRDANREEIDRLYSENVGNMFMRFAYGIVVSSLTYLAMLKPKAKNNLLYASEFAHSKKHTNYTNQSVRNITNPVYDLNYEDNITLTKLTTKHSSWKISCEFQVRGHYRHYKNGKVVFIKSYEKGKGNKIKQTQLQLNPSC